MTTVLAHGCWDLIHPGHIAHLEAARSLGDKLIVSITADQYVNKGPGRPVFTAEDRAQLIASLRLVDETFICESPDATPAIEAFHPEIYVKGQDYLTEDTAGNLISEKSLVESYGGRVEFTRTPLMSSSSLIKQSSPTIPQRALDWIAASGLTWKDVRPWLERAQAVNGLVAGETIRDVYEYVIPAGKSPKESVITWLDDPLHPNDDWAGGAAVVAGHLRAMCDSVDMQFPAQPVVKTRKVHFPFTQKVYSEASIPEVKPCVEIEHDGLVVCADFGHGYFSPPPLVDGYLALTVQANSLNWGLNRVTKWTGAEYIVLDSAEVQLATDERGLSDTEAAQRLVMKMDRGNGCQVVVTRGHMGAVLVTRDGCWTVPSFTDRAVDRIGAGDAFLAFTSPLVYVGAPVEVALLVGSCAAALHVQTPGNEALKREAVRGFVKAALA